MHNLTRITCLSLLVGLSACSSNSPVDPDTLPVELGPVQGNMGAEVVWSRSIGRGADALSNPLRVAVVGDRLFVSDYSGSVKALNLTTGQPVWERNLRTSVAAGVGVGDGLVLLSDSAGTVYALEQTTGAERWRRSMASEVLAPPQAGSGSTIVLAQDGRLYALSSTDGTQNWRVEVEKPLLTLRGNASPTIAEGVAFVGHDSGKVAGYRLSDGAILWNARVGVPEGTNELERMVDVDAAPLLHNGIVYGLSYQGGLLAINPQTGRGQWFQEASSVKELGASGGTVAMTDGDGTVRAFSATSGDLLWESSAVRNRGVSGPAVDELYVAVADFEGYLHLLRRATGAMAERIRVSRNPVRSPLVNTPQGILVLDDSGRLSLVRVFDRR